MLLNVLKKKKKKKVSYHHQLELRCLEFSAAAF